MDVTWVTDRIGLGGGIWNEQNMQELVRMGVTHDLDMQIEFNDTPLAERYAIEVLWNPTDDDFQLKPLELFEKGVQFALGALEKPETKVYIHCAAGVHRAAMMTLAVMCAMGWDLDEAMTLIEARRPVVDFADVYVESVRRYVESRSQAAGVRSQEKL